jgi:membrane associated rhomboid family serine protease
MQYQGPMTTPFLSPINKKLIITAVVFFLLNSLLGLLGFGQVINHWLGLNPALFLAGHIYQLFTYSLVHNQLMGVLFECLIIWFLGSELESRWGGKTYLQFLLSAAIGGGLLYIFLGVIISGLGWTNFLLGMSSTSLIGLAGIANALCLAYAIIYPEKQFLFMFLFPLKAKWFCTLMIGILLYTGIFSAGGHSAFGHLFAMAAGFVFLHFKAQSLGATKTTFHPIKNWLNSREQQKKLKKMRQSNLYIVPKDGKEDDDDQRPTYH